MRLLSLSLPKVTQQRRISLRNSSGNTKHRSSKLQWYLVPARWGATSLWFTSIPIFEWSFPE